MITSDPKRITLYDLSGPAAIGLAHAVAQARYGSRLMFPSSWLVHKILVVMRVFKDQFPDPEIITVAHVEQLLFLARAAGIL